MPTQTKPPQSFVPPNYLCFSLKLFAKLLSLLASAQLNQSTNQHCVFQWRVTFVFLPAVQVFLTLMIELEILCNLSAFAISSRSIVFFKVTVHN